MEPVQRHMVAYIWQMITLCGIASAMGDGYAYIYSPMGAPVNVHFGKLGFDTVKASWFDPRNGRLTPCMVVPGRDSGLMAPPSCGRGNDWVLVLDRLV